MSKTDREIALAIIVLALVVIAFVLCAWRFGWELLPRGGVNGLIEELKTMKDSKERLKKKYPDMVDEIDEIMEMERARIIEKWGENS